MDNPLRHLPLDAAGPPPSAGRAVGVLLHGRGRTTADMLDLAGQLDVPGMSWIAIPAVEGSWYPRGFMAEVADNQPQLDHALARIDDVLGDLERQSVPRERVALIGFSQGACLATQYVFLNPRRYLALVAFTGALIGPPGSAWAAAPTWPGRRCCWPPPRPTPGSRSTASWRPPRSCRA